MTACKPNVEQNSLIHISRIIQDLCLRDCLHVKRLQKIVNNRIEKSKNCHRKRLDFEYKAVTG